MRELQIFAFGDNLVRTVQKDGEPWWIARDVCAVLGLDVNSGARNLDDDEKGLHIMQTPGGPQEMTTISESGLYNLIFRSRKAEAKAFRRWVTHEVLPALRRTGVYSMSQGNSPAERIRGLIEEFGQYIDKPSMGKLVLAAANSIMPIQMPQKGHRGTGTTQTVWLPLVREFIEVSGKVVKDPKAFVPRNTFAFVFREWSRGRAEIEGLPVVTNQTVSACVSMLGIGTRASHKFARVWTGIRLVNDPGEVPLWTDRIGEADS